MATVSPETIRTVNAMISSDALIRARVTDFITRSWTSLDNYRDADIARFIKAVLPVVQGAQWQLAALTDAYLAQVAAQTLGGSAAPLGLSTAEVTGTALRGVDPSEVYRRPATQLYTDLSKGKPFQEAVTSGLRRALNIAMTDLQLAKTHSARAVLSQDDRVVGHRRVLSGSENCGICHIASTQRYHKENLQPIHPGCDCGVAAIYGTEDPGQVIDEEHLSEVHDAVAERFGDSSADGRRIDYKKLIIVREHGEIGPVLTIKGQHFDGPSSI